MANEHERSEQRTSRMAVASLITGITGILSIPLAFFAIPEILSVLAIIFGAVGMKRSRRTGVKDHGMAVAGLVLGIIGLILLVVLAMYLTVAFMNWD